MDLSAWLRELGLERYEQAFRDSEVDFEVLPELTEADLEGLGLPLGPRRKLLKAIRVLGEGGVAYEAKSASETAPGLAAERRQLTVMICDLVGSTELSVRLDPEDMREVIRAYQNAVAGEIERFEGHVAKFMGDGVLAYFGYPKAHEDDAERAARAGMAVAEAVGRLTAPGGEALAARVGIATGLVVVGDLVGDGAAQEQAVVGDTPNLAARLQAIAAPNSVVIDPTTRGLLGGLFEYADLGQHMLKGFAAPVGAWRVVRESGAESRFEASHGERLAPLVGREHEIGLILERWERTKEGEGQVVLLAGEPGIGKSRVVRALRERLADEPLTPLSHYCSPYHTNSALFPVIRLLERAARFERDDPPERRLDKLQVLLGRGTDRLADAMPLIALLLGISTGDRYPPLTLSPQKQKQRTLEALAEQVEGLAARQPVLALYEDVHWIDPTTLEILGLLIERVQRLPVLMLVTYRPEFSPPWTGHAHVTQLSLARLTRRHGSAMVERLAGGKALPAEVLVQILEKTDGVPLFVEELTKTVLESGLLRDAGDRYEVASSSSHLAIPATLHASLMARLDRLGPAKEVAQIGAAIGREFAYELLTAISHQSQDDLDAALNQLVASELVFRSGTSPDASYRFKHALVQDAAYQSLLKPKRRELHAAIAQAIENRFPEIAAATPEVVAHHYTEAAMAVQAIPYWHKAAQIAVRRPAYEETIAHLRHGLDLIEQIADPEARVRLEIPLRMTNGMALAASRGPVEGVGRNYARARELCEQIGDRQQLYVALWGGWWVESQRMNFETARELADDLLSLAEEQANEEFLLQAYHASWTTALYEGALRQCNEHAERGIALYNADRHHHQASRYGAHDAGVCCRVHAGLTLLLLGYPDGAARRAAEGVALAQQLSQFYSLAQALFFSSVICQYRGDVGAAQELSERLVSMASEHGVAVFRESGVVVRGWALVAHGDVERGIAEIESGLNEMRSMGAGLRRSYFLWLLAEACARAGDYYRGLEAVSEALDFVRERGEHWWEAELHRLKGELLRVRSPSAWADAEPCFHRAIDIARRQDARLLELRASTSLAQTWRACGRRVDAYELLVPVYGWFTEGFDTPALKEAKALLDELA